MAIEMGYESVLYIGTAGTTAATQVDDDLVDLDYDLSLDKATTTSRGDSSSVPITTEKVVARNPAITWKMLNNPTNAQLVTMLTAAVSGGPLAVKIVDGGGTTRFDGDVTLAKKFNAQLSAEGGYDFTASATKESGRLPTLG